MNTILGEERCNDATLPNKGINRSAASEFRMISPMLYAAPGYANRYAARNCQSCFTARSVTDIIPREEQSTGVTVQGIQFVTNDKAEKVAVQIDLRKHAGVWEDVCDSITARNRSREPRESIESVKERLIKRCKLNG